MTKIQIIPLPGSRKLCLIFFRNGQLRWRLVSFRAFVASYHNLIKILPVSEWLDLAPRTKYITVWIRLDFIFQKKKFFLVDKLVVCLAIWEQCEDESTMCQYNAVTYSLTDRQICLCSQWSRADGCKISLGWIIPASLYRRQKVLLENEEVPCKMRWQRRERPGMNWAGTPKNEMDGGK